MFQMTIEIFTGKDNKLNEDSTMFQTFVSLVVFIIFYYILNDRESFLKD